MHRSTPSSRPAALRSFLILGATLFSLLASTPRTFAAESYAYDSIGRLMDVTYDNGSSLHYTYDQNGNILSIVTSLAVTGIETEQSPLVFAMGRPTPNPGSGSRSVQFTIAEAGRVTLNVFDVHGRTVATLYDRDLTPGRYVARFGSDQWAGGVYFYKLTSAGRVIIGRIVVLR